jgi:hypothetical protein
MVPHIKRYKLPLLPFERDLIEIAGISEDEYRFFVAEALKLAKVRPADYQHIPEVRATGFEIVLINLAIGVALSAASYLLTPKPRAPRGADQVRQRQLASREGLTAFAPTTGFDTQAEVANYGDPIPIIFGRYTGTTGGMLVSPKLVWSRAFSYGNQQAIKQLFVVGEQGVGTAGIDRPDLQGIFLGNTPLDAAYEHTFAFYWRSGTFNGTSRIKASNLRYGTRARQGEQNAGAFGDPQTNDDIFLAPTRDSENDTAFCSAHTPTSNVEFGAYAPVYNGTDYRVNFKLVTIVEIEGDLDDPGNQLLLERAKIAGTYGRDIPGERGFIRNQYQDGTGRAYSRRMGITSINGQTVTSGNLAVQTVLKGSVCQFTITGGKLPANFYYRGTSKNVSVDDINNELESQRTAADTTLQLGETIQIGFTLWKVISRSLPIWTLGQTQVITLECIEVFGFGSESRTIGMVPSSLLNTDVTSNNVNEGKTSIIPISFYPLMRTQVGTVRNTRPCDVTEIGIKSQVWNRANGLCNFQSLASPEELRKAESNRVQLSSGTMTSYFKRSSVFALQVRPAGTDANGFDYAWQSLGRSFCVTGEQPLDIYNYIRIQHPERRQYEFRFVPRTGADVIRHMGPNDYIWQLNSRQSAGNNTSISDTVNVPSYGQFRIFATGSLVNQSQLLFNAEMSQGGVELPVATTVDAPVEVTVQRYDPQNTGVQVSLIRQAFITEVLGALSNKNIGQTYSANVTYNLAGGKTLTVRWSAQVVSNQNSDGSYINSSLIGYSKVWFSPSTTVVSFGGSNWSTNDIFSDYRSISAGNTFGGSMPSNFCRVGDTGCTQIGSVLQVTRLQPTQTTVTINAERVFESNSQMADVSFYSSLLQKSNESSPEHAITYVNEIIDNNVTPNYDNLVMAGLALKASRTYSALDQIRVWKDDGLPVQRWHPDDGGSIGPSNLFCDLVYYLLTDKVAGAGNAISQQQIRTADLAATARFLRTNKLFFDGAIADPVNIREYVTRLAPSFLCNFVIADGLFSVVPALPTTVSGGISTGAVPIKGLFTGGNIIEDSFSVEYINSEERDSIQAVMRYRQGVKNQLPEERTLVVRWNEAGSTDHKIESFDLTQFCTSRDHALLAAKYILSVRRRITHTVRFKTTPQGLSLAPGNFIRVVTQANPYNGANNGVVADDGTITSITPLANGNYSIIYYQPPATAVATGTLTVSNGATAQSALFGAVFTVSSGSTQNNVYMVEQLTLDEEGMVEIVASEFPTDAGYSSRIAQDVTSGSAFLTEG